KKYYQVAIRKGNGGNYYNISNVKNNTYYNYVIRASKSSNGKSQFITKQSYPVSSLSLNSKAGNVTDIKINSKNITGKVGKKIQLKAKISNNKNQKLYNKSLRWYSTNKKIVTVDNHTGKITLKKKGSAKIWVKAHNGRNSLRIKVVVK
ncbi:MAG: Ig-like domain-containing protein, partial [Bacilli bacterium]|nr:Ig-like domain-containing protein [Bacilli bacterium]